MLGMPKPGARPAIGNFACTGDGLGDRPLVVRADEDDGRAERGREHHRLVDVALAGGAVAEVGGRDLVGAVALDAHRVADGVQRLRADDDLRRRGVDVVRVVGGVLFAAPRDDEVGGLGAADVVHADLAVAREDEVVGAEGAGGADLRGLLALAGRPESELALALQGDALGVDAAHEHHVAIEALQHRGVDVRDPALEVRVGDALAVGGQQPGDIVGVGREIGQGVQGVRHRHHSSVATLPREAGRRGSPAASPTRSRIRRSRTSLKQSSIDLSMLPTHEPSRPCYRFAL